MSTSHDSAVRTAPQRIVASYARYEDAERAVDYLSDRKFPVQRTVIVGRGLELVEPVTGRLTYLRAAGRGAGVGAVAGALFGWLFGAFGWVAPLVAGLLLALYGAVFGAVVGAAIGALLGVVGHAFSGGRRDFTSRPGLRADAYDLLIDADLADQARRMLSSAGGPGTGTAPG